MVRKQFTRTLAALALACAAVSSYGQVIEKGFYTETDPPKAFATWKLTGSLEGLPLRATCYLGRNNAGDVTFAASYKEGNFLATGHASLIFSYGDDLPMIRKRATELYQLRTDGLVVMYNTVGGMSLKFVSPSITIAYTAMKQCATVYKGKIAIDVSGLQDPVTIPTNYTPQGRYDETPQDINLSRDGKL